MSINRHRLLWFLSLLLVVSLVAAACGDADDEPGATPTTTEDEMGDDDMGDEEMSEDGMSDEEMTDDMSDEDMSDEEMSDDMSEDEMSDEGDG